MVQKVAYNVGALRQAARRVFDLKYVSSGLRKTLCYMPQLGSSNYSVKIKNDIKMTKEQLLKTRWKVIADFPDSDFVVGNIEDRNWSKYVNGEDETDGIVWSISNFPHLFKELEWWEERAIEDLPDYVKYQKLIYKAKDKFLASVRCEAHPYDGKELDADWGSCLPATEEEYLSAVAQLEDAKGSS